MAIAIYTVWTNSEYERDLLAMFTDSTAAEEYAAAHDGIVCPDEAYDSMQECEAMQLF
jgi:hypothetical protein